MTAITEPLVDAGLALGEGPISLGEDRYACVDIRGGKVLGGSLDGDLVVLAECRRPSALALLPDGTLAVAAGTGLSLIGDDRTRIDVPAQASDIRLNDGKVDPRGRFVAGTMADPPREGAGSLWAFSDGTAAPLLEGVTISNGLCWSASGETLYYIDTPTGRVDALDYDVDRCALSDRRTIVTISPELGVPDGMTIDEEGGLWVALWGGSAVHRYEGDELTEVLCLPTAYVTCPVFVGDGHEVLLVTTAAEPAVGDPAAGHIYAHLPGTRGYPTGTLDPSSVFGTGHA